jgi:mono/diheme cytochrome c family protein
MNLSSGLSIRCLLASATIALGLSPAVAADTKPSASADYEKVIRPFLEKHCVDCHDQGMAKGDLRLDSLAADFRDRKAAEVWMHVYDRMRDGEMPPKKKPQPEAAERDAVLRWLAGQIRSNASRPSVIRRLNRIEYENTLRDLFDLPWLDVKELLPPDAESQGFDTVADALDISYVQMARYLEAADVALDQAIATSPEKPESKVARDWPQNMGWWWARAGIGAGVPLAENGPDPIWDKSTGKLQAGLDVKTLAPIKALGIFFHADPASPLSMESGKLRIRTAGVYRFSVSAYAFDWDKGAVLPAKAGRPYQLTTATKSLGFFDAPADQPAVATVTTWLNVNESVNFNPVSLVHGAGLRNGAADITRPGVAFEWAEIEGPLNAQWPPAGHQRLFGDLPLEEWQKEWGTDRPARKQGGKVYTVVSHEPLADAERLLRDFARRAFRRPAVEEEIQRYLAVARARIDAHASFEEAMRSAYRAILCSPDFLFLHSEPGPPDNYALAARLSYFLWSSTPDEELLRLAAGGSLRRPAVLRSQTERLLADPKARRFVENFTGQWLKLRDINATQPDRQLYPELEFESDVAAYAVDSMVEETRLFFAAMLRDDLSVTNVIDSDFAMLNEPLAKIYGIEGVAGAALRPVKLSPGSHRGGILTQASILKTAANGTTTSPVTRGVWVTTRLLGRPIPPPPPNTPAIDPDVRGATTIREQLAKHRSLESCATCHAKMDPPGFALESYDVVGGWRELYRVLDGVRLNRKGPPVDASGETVKGRPFRDIEELKQLLLAEPDQLARNLATKLLTYAAGTAPSGPDRFEVEEIVGRLRAKNYGLRALVHEVVESKAFRQE